MTISYVTFNRERQRWQYARGVPRHLRPLFGGKAHFKRQWLMSAPRADTPSAERAAISEAEPFKQRDDQTIAGLRLGTTAAQKTLFWKLRRAKAQMGATGALTDAHAQEIARRLGVREDQVQEMDARLAGDASLDTPFSQMRDDDAGTTWVQVLADPAPDPEQQVACCQIAEQRSAGLRAALKVLTDRERRILTARRLSDEPATLEALAGQFGISRERVRQIEVRALERVGSAMRAGGPDCSGATGTAALDRFHQ